MDTVGPKDLAAYLRAGDSPTAGTKHPDELGDPNEVALAKHRT
ncbi:hypothetical protein [Qipengyuania qiaonensis]|nr:hypothetical protein [Qipengyuania qiaonensis]